MHHRLPTLLLLLGLLASPAMAGNHSWEFTELFSNADGTIQFIELFTHEDLEHKLGGVKMVSTSTGQTYVFPANLPNAQTENTWVLVATAAFSELEGAPAPDYILPDAFFDPAGDSLSYKGTTDIWTFSALPTNGTDSLDRSTGVGLNTPTNYAGETGSVDASSPLPTGAWWGLVALVGMLVLGAGALIGRTRGEPGAA